MTKRTGANRKKKKSELRTRHKGLGRRLLFVCTAVTVALGVISGALIGGKIAIKAIASRVNSSELFTISEVEVRGSSDALCKSLREVITRNLPEKFLKIDKKTVSASVLENPLIESVKIARTLRGKVVVHVKERNPVAMVNQGQILLVDRHGVLFPVTPGVSYDLPMFWGIRDSTGEGRVRMVRRDDLSRILSFVRIAGKIDSRTYSQISQIRLTSSDMRFTFQMDPVEVVVGNRELDSQLIRLRHLRESFQSESFSPVRIDLRYQNLAFVTHTEKVKSERLVAVSD